MFRTAAIAITGLLCAGTAAAQPGAYCPPAPADPAARPPVPEPPRWGLGLRTTSVGIANVDDEDDRIELAGAGVQLRYRLADDWRAELVLEGADGEPEAGGFERSSAFATLALHYVFNPYDNWNWYALGGLGGTATEIRSMTETGAERVEEFAETHLQFGVGLERTFDRIAIGAELRGTGWVRDDEAGDAPAYAGMDGPVPVGSSGGSFHLHATYWF